ncbi:hypothetical protein [Aureimonas pseudogalii]|uniref:Uncharacterized protein n=1 Tax=Aureimonas pseudogalii TaxID=1744844 RepID=A0A7W6EFD9_9HYPH|nr:hypothetical protein [Aureimonas pseudogalii]MBB3998412.1 hypothetical protein [Aureimonas pseudogalii]
METKEGREFRLRYVGQRFEGARLPLDVISDLPAFRNLVVAFAKDIWRAENHGRVRLPKGFDQALGFDLVALEDGSAVPCLAWSRESAQVPLPTMSDYIDTVVDAAYQQAVDLMDRAARGDYPAGALSVAAVRALDRFGSSLREDERIEFLGSAGRDGNVVSITPERRRQFLKKVKDTYTLRVEGIGWLSGLSTEAGWIEVQTDQHGSLRIPVDGDEVHQAFDGNTRQRVRFDLSVIFDREDAVRSVAEAHDVAMIDEEVDQAIEKAETRLSHLKTLEDGWKDGEGVAIADRSIKNAQHLLARRSTLATSFRIYPTLEGGVQIEFEAGGWELSVEMSANGEVEFYGSRLDGTADFDPSTYEGIDEAFLEELDDRVGAYPTTGVFS